MGGGKWKVHRHDALSWEFTQYTDKATGRGVLLVEITSQRMFRREFLKRIPSGNGVGFGHNLLFVRPLQGKSLYVGDCYVVMTNRAPLNYRLTLRCASCKEECKGEVNWHFAEDPTKPPDFVSVDG
jgi:hypothetical protein